MQDRRARRAVAALSAAVLLVIGWLSARHEAEVSHVRDQRGDMVHAQGLADHHEVSAAAHLHSRDDHGHAGACALLAVTGAAALTPAAPAALALPAIAAEPEAVPLVPIHGAIAPYRIAPKTSPPAAV